MNEQLSDNLGQEKMAKITPREAQVRKPVELTPAEDERLVDILSQAKAAERAGDKAEAIRLYQSYQDQYEAIRLEKRGERKVSPEVLESSQKVYDFIFGDGKYNLQELYDDGQIIGLNKEQQEAI